MSQRQWTAEERTIIDEMITAGHQYEAIAERLGTTRAAVTGQCAVWGIRHATSCDMYTGADVARLFGLRSRNNVRTWVRVGWLVAHGAGYRHRFRLRDLRAFIRNVDTWMAWGAQGITDPALRAEALAARARGPQWLTTADVGAHYSVTQEAVQLWIKQGLIPATKWHDWYIRSDHLAGFVPPCMREKE